MSDKQDSEAISGWQATQAALVELTRTARRQLILYCPELDPKVMGTSPWLDALRERLTTNNRLRVLMVLPPAAEWARDAPQLVTLIGRLSSGIEVRTLSAQANSDRPEFGQFLASADGLNVLRIINAHHYDGVYRQFARAEAREAASFFDVAWARAQPDAELRNLRI